MAGRNYWKNIRIKTTDLQPASLSYYHLCRKILFPIFITRKKKGDGIIV